MSRVCTGVIVGITKPASNDELLRTAEVLGLTFPGVKFAVVANAASVAFQYEDLEQWGPSQHVDTE